MAKRAEHLTTLANAEAAALGHESLGTEHLLLALTRQDGTVAARALADQGVQPEPLRVAIIRIVQTAPAEPRDRRPSTPRVRKVIELAVGEARALGHCYVGPEHVLLGLLRVEEGVGVHAIRALGADPGAIRAAVLARLEQT